MSKRNHRTVRPKWICGAGEEGVDHERDEGDELPEGFLSTEKARAKEAQTEKDEAEKKEREETDEEDIDCEDLEQEYGQRKTKHMLDPKLPSQEEVRQHCLTHMPYRNWCLHCVRGRGKEMEHKKKRDDGEQTIPEYHMDYCFPGDEDGQKLTTLVVVEKETKMKKAAVVPSKGSTGRYAAKMVLDLIAECGDKDRPIIVKSDQEPAILFLVDDVCTSRTGAKTIVEQAPKRSKGSNGIVERAVQSFEQYLRTLKSALDARMEVKIDTRHPILTWLCDYASFLMNRLEVAADGRTAYERNKGKRATVQGLEFGETVMWKHNGTTAKFEKINARWSRGLFVGVKVASNEVIVVDESSKAVKYVRTVRRVPEEQRWSSDNLAWVQSVPWNMGQGDDEADGEIPEFDVKHGPGRRLTSSEVEEIQTKDKSNIVHRAHLRRADFERFGFTDRCPGCSAIIRGLKPQPHSEQCRRRMERLLEDDVRIKNAKARLSDKGRRLRGEEHGGGGEEKRRRLQEMEDQAMTEENPVKLAKLFEDYRAEYMKDQADREEADTKRRKLQDIEDEVMGMEDLKRAAELYQEYMHEHKRQRCERNMQETSSSSGGPAQFIEPEVMNVDRIFAEIDQIMAEEWADQELELQKSIEEYAWDDVNNFALPIDKVREARKEEMEHMMGKTFVVVKKSEAYRVTGTHPISTKWVDTDKNHGNGDLLVRSRWVARDFRARGEKDREDLFSATPPLELIRYLLSRQATRREDGRERKTLYIDVKKAHLIPKCTRDVYVELPPEAGAQEDECGKLRYWLYGCRPAAQAWEEDYSGEFEAAEFKRLTSCPVAFSHKERDLAGGVHGDDFVFCGVDEDLDFVEHLLREKYEIKVRGRLGSGESDKKEIDMLGRKIKLPSWGITWEDDDRHRKLIMEQFGLDSESNILTKNGYKEDGNVEEDTSQKLNTKECKAYRTLAARMNFMAQDNLVIQFAAKEVCRKMASPDNGDFMRAKRLARFIAGIIAVEWEFPWQEEEEAKVLRVLVDSDWAGCHRTRRSTSGGIMVLGRHPVKTWSTTQPVVALSSAEAELYSMSEGASRGLAFRTILEEMNVKVDAPIILTDSAAAKAFASTRGLGRMRHLEVKDLWMQSLVRDGRLRLGKVRGDRNPADVLTKYLDRATLIAVSALGGFRVVPAGTRDRAEGGC